MKLIYVLIVIGLFAITLTGCAMIISNKDNEKIDIEKKPEEHKSYVEPEPDILVSDVISKIDFTFDDDKVAVDKFDGEYIYIKTWDNDKFAVIDLEGNFVVPWQEGHLHIGYASEDVFTISYYVDIQHEQLDGACDVAAETLYNFYVKDYGFIYKENLKGIFYLPEFVGGYAMEHGHDGEKEFVKFIDREGNIVREIYPKDDEYQYIERYGGYIYYRDGFGEDGNYKYVYEDIITGEKHENNPVSIDTSYRELFPADALIEKNNTNKAIVTDEENIGLYDLTTGDKIEDLEYDIYINYYLKDTYYIKSLRDENHDYITEIYDFEGNKLAIFYENFKMHDASDSLIYQYGGEAFYWKIGD